MISRKNVDGRSCGPRSPGGTPLQVDAASISAASSSSGLAGLQSGQIDDERVAEVLPYVCGGDHDPWPTPGPGRTPVRRYAEAPEQVLDQPEGRVEDELERHPDRSTREHERREHDRADPVAAPNSVLSSSSASASPRTIDPITAATVNNDGVGSTTSQLSLLVEPLDVVVDPDEGRERGGDVPVEERRAGCCRARAGR